MLFPVAPEVLHRVEFRRVSGQALQFEPGPLAGDPVLDQAAAVRGQAVPDDQQPAREIGQEMAARTDPGAAISFQLEAALGDGRDNLVAFLLPALSWTHSRSPGDRVSYSRTLPSVPDFIAQHLAAIRQLFDYLTTGGILELNPAASVRGPKYVVKRGKTPVLSAEEARPLLDSIESNTLIGLRDRALIGAMVYSFARVGATVTIRVGDYFQQRKQLLANGYPVYDRKPERDPLS